MKRKITFFVISLLVLFPLFTSCGAETGDDDDFETLVLDGVLNGFMGDLKSASVPQSGNTYYLSSSASTEGSGTSSSPFKSFDTALSKLKPGDTLIVEGAVKSSKTLRPSVNGTSDNYITIKGSSGATFSGENITENHNKILTLENCSYLKIEGIAFKDCTKTKNGGGGICIYPPSHHIIISNCTFSNLKTTAPTNHGTANGIIVYGNSSGQSINNIFISGNTFTKMETGWGECITVTANTEYVNIISNTINDNGNIGIDVGGNYGYCKDASKDFARYIYIYNNTVKNCISPNAAAASIYCDGGQHIVIKGNKISGGQTGFSTGAEQVPPNESYSTGDILIEGNEVKNFPKGVWHCGGWKATLGWVQSVAFRNNTCTDNGYGEHQAVVVFNKCRDIIMEKNTFKNPDYSNVTKTYYTPSISSYRSNVVENDNDWGW